MTTTTLTDLGWSAHFDRQLNPETVGEPARVSAIHRDRLEALTPGGTLDLISALPMSDLAVGDWVLQDGTHVLQRLAPRGELLRRAAGGTRHQQRIAANVDVLGIVTSCNADFKPARIERYLALAATAGALPLVILTKADLAEDVTTFRRAAERLSPLLAAVALDARDPEAVKILAPWCGTGQTLALLGSSGVGKTTLRNSLTGEAEATATIREDDAKGRHTTTSRALRQVANGGWLIDTPGMRELGLTDAADGIDTVFDDLSSLASQCRFADCQHEGEPGCAIAAAIAAGHVEPDRLDRWQRLRREDRFNSESAAETRARHRSRQKMYNQGKRRGLSKRDWGD